MSPTHTDLVIQISTAKMAANAPDSESLVAELRETLRPGVEIALVYRGYMATTSILWLEGPLEDLSLRAGVRLLGVSVLSGSYSETAAAQDEVPETTPCESTGETLGCPNG